MESRRFWPTPLAFGAPVGGDPGSVATYLRCDGIVNNHIKKGLLLSLLVKKIKIGEYLAKIQARSYPVHFLHLTTTLLKDEEFTRHLQYGEELSHRC